MIIVASLGQNLVLAKSLQEILKKKGLDLEILNLVDLDLPLYSTKEQKIGLPPKAMECYDLVHKAKALIVLAPEYNAGIPPVLSNFIAWVSVVSKDWREVFKNKSALIGTHSGSGGVNVLNAMRIQLSYLGMNVMGRDILIHYKKPLVDQSAQEILEQFIIHHNK